MMVSLALLLLVFQSLATATFNSPLVRVQNGTLKGSYLPAFHQDLFLGVPFAQPPVQDLRFRHPESLNSSWHGIRSAESRGLSCQGYAGFAEGLTMGEDCSTLDIVRPAGPAQHLLPVFVWIYGGGFTAGGSADSRYNTSYMVKTSVALGKPIISVSINYRLGGWGFLASKEVAREEGLNSGLFDQRLALRWIKENIKSFCGDPDAITIAGESAGAFSVGYHLVGNKGDNEGLFRAAIFQSGSALSPAVRRVPQEIGPYQEIYDNVTRIVGCDEKVDTLRCLRGVTFPQLSRALEPFVLTPVMDGEFLNRLPSQSYAEHKVAKVAVLAGSNTDEGTATFFGPRGTLNTDEDVASYISNLGLGGLTPEQVRKVMHLYPNDLSQGCPFNTGNERFAQNGKHYKRGAAIATDSAIAAGRRHTAEFHGAYHPTYSYRFDQPPWNNIEPLIVTEAPVFATHFSEIAFVFNKDPDESRNDSNWIGPNPEFHQLGEQISSAWISFVHELNPNSGMRMGLPYWPRYSRNNQRNMVFRACGSYVERDDWRAPQLAFWRTVWKDLET